MFKELRRLDSVLRILSRNRNADGNQRYNPAVSNVWNYWNIFKNMFWKQGYNFKDYFKEIAMSPTFISRNFEIR